MVLMVPRGTSELGMGELKCKRLRMSRMPHILLETSIQSLTLSSLNLSTYVLSLLLPTKQICEIPLKVYLPSSYQFLRALLLDKFQELIYCLIFGFFCQSFLQDSISFIVRCFLVYEVRLIAVFVDHIISCMTCHCS